MNLEDKIPILRARRSSKIKINPVFKTSNEDLTASHGGSKSSSIHHHNNENGSKNSYHSTPQSTQFHRKYPKYASDCLNIEIIGNCSYFNHPESFNEVFAVKDRIFYLCEDHVYYTSKDNYSLTTTPGISRNSSLICEGPKVFYFITKGKVGKGKDKNYSIIDGVNAIEDISGNHNDIFAVDRFGICYKLSKEGKVEIKYKEKIVRIIKANDIDACLLQNGLIETTNVFYGDDFYVDIAGDKDIVAILGKGRDNYMAIGNDKVLYSDLFVIEDYFLGKKNKL